MSEEVRQPEATGAVGSIEEQQKHVLLVNGSPHRNGRTKHALETVAGELEAAGYGIDWFDLGAKPVRGCIDCERCAKTSHCVFADDGCNELIDKMVAADAIIIGTPVYYAGPNGALCALLDRVFYAAVEHGHQLAGKPAAAVATAWREGGSTALDRIYKYFTNAQMPIVSGDYWTIQLGDEDEWGKKTLRKLGQNMVALLGSLD